MQLNIMKEAREAFKTGIIILRNHRLAYQLLTQLDILLFSPHRTVQAYLIKGAVRDTNQATTTLFIGSESSSHQFASTVYSKPFEITYRGELPFRCASSFFKTCQAEIVAIRVDKPFAGRYSRSFMLLPNVSFALDLRRSMHEITRGMSRRRRRDLKKIEGSNYTYTVHRQSSEAFDFFYWKMYLPYITKRFDKAAYIKSFLESRIVYDLNGGIVMVEKDKQPLAGILFQTQGKTLLALSLGLYEGSLESIRASEAALFYLVTWAKAEGMETLDYGVSMPFLRNGVFTYKKEWGMNVKEPNIQSFCALRINYLTDGSLAFLQQNPFIFTEKGRLIGVIFQDHRPTEIELKQILSDHFLPKLDSLRVISYYHNDSTIVEKTPPDTPPKSFSSALSEPLLNICSLLKRHGFGVEVSELGE